MIGLLPFAGQMIGFYLGERPLLPTLPTYWLGILTSVKWCSRKSKIYHPAAFWGEDLACGNGRRPTEEEITSAKETVLRNGGQYVAQPQDCDAFTVSYHEGRRVARRQDHILFALRKSEGEYDTFPGALTHEFQPILSLPPTSLAEEARIRGCRRRGLRGTRPDRTRLREALLPSQHVSSRVAEAFIGPVDTSSEPTIWR